jgi:NADH-quinone oxidoreductase subunit E
MNDSLTNFEIRKLIQECGSSEKNLIAILKKIQQKSGHNYIKSEWSEIVAEELKIPLTKLYDVLTFFAIFSTIPRGKYIIEVCNSAPCQVCGAKTAASIFEKILGIKVGQTTDDGLFTLQYTSCLGSCDSSPAVRIGDDIIGNINENTAFSLISNLRRVCDV